MFLFLICLSLGTFACDALLNDLPKRCTLPLDMGKTPCKEGKKEIRYHFDIKSEMPLAFEYSGCGGNENNFKSAGDCTAQCVGDIADYVTCPFGSDPLPGTEICKDDKDCGPKGICTMFIQFSRCCDKELTRKFESDLNPKCPKGKKVLQTQQNGNLKTVVGKTCKSNFCPTGTVCVDGYYYASCCK